MKKFTTTHIIFLASIITFDFAFGMIVKNVLSPTGIFSMIRIDMIVPVMLMMLTRLIIDRFGTLIIYEGMWGVLATVAMPAAFGLPGPLKLIPALAKGITYDLLFSSLRRFKRGRVFGAAIIGGFVATLVVVAVKVMLGLPWARVTQILLSLQILTSILINGIGAYLALLVWKRIQKTHLVKRIAVDK